MNICQGCGESTTNPKYCSKSCSVRVNNHLQPKRVRKPSGVICVCGKPCARAYQTHCSGKCFREAQYREWIQQWLTEEVSGGTKWGGVAAPIKRWLRDTRGNACELCGWNEVHPTTNKVPVEVDHIDGDHLNNRPDNLRLLCPNCHSLTPTYRALNKGNGRKTRHSPLV